MRLRNWFMSVVGAAIVTAGAQTGAAQQQVYQPANPQMVMVSAESLTGVLERLDAMEAKFESMASAECGACDSEWIDVSEQKFSVNVGGRVFGDYVNFASQNAGSRAVVGDAQDYVEFRSLRLFMDGDGYGVVDYRFELDFEPENGDVDDPAVEIQDIYFGLKELPLNSYLRFGHFKAAHSLEQMTDQRFITFMERSLMDNFTAGRRMGAQYYWESNTRNATFAAGLFFDGNGNGDTFSIDKQRLNDNQGLLAPFRITYLPYYDEPSCGRYMVHTGLSGFYFDDADDAVTVAVRPEFHEAPIVLSVTGAADDLYGLTPEFAAVWGPGSVQAEYTYIEIEDLGIENHAAYVQASYFLTGEHRQYNRGTRGAYGSNYSSFGRVTPFSNFWIVPGCTGPGAWEVAARWSYLELDDAVGSNQLNNFTAGLNWYWNPHVRWMFNYIHSEADYANPALANAETDTIGIRGQIDW